LDVGIGLPEVIQTSDGNSYLHLPGVIMAENAPGETRYLLSDGLGSIRQVVDEAGEVVDHNEYGPYGNPVTDHVSRITPYGYTGEWWENDVGLLHLRARWYLPETGTFLSRDPVESEPAYQYVRGNPVNRIDPSGMQSGENCHYEMVDPMLPFLGWVYVCSDQPQDESDPSDMEETTEPIRDTTDPALVPGGPIIELPSIADIAKTTIFVAASHKLEMDGVVIGSTGGINVLFAPAFQAIFPMVEIEDACLPTTGVVGGIEIVYDFKHMERGVFYYLGPNLNIGSIANAGVAMYIGETRGFIYQSYEKGVTSYGGFNAGIGLSFSVEKPIPIVPGPNVNVTFTEGIPLKNTPGEKFKDINPGGVFATYVALGGGGSTDLIPIVGGDISVANYGSPPAMLGRLLYIPLYLEYWPGVSEDYIIFIKKNRIHRKFAATMIEFELRSMGTSKMADRVMKKYHDPITQLWKFVDKPEVVRRP
jgi:RHS repeat-associated protein